MRPRTIEEEENHVCTKENAQKLISELFSFIDAVDNFCKQKCDCLDSNTVKYVIKHIRRLADELYCELEAYDVQP